MSLETLDFIILLSLSIVLGGLFGSFATALIYRIPRNIPIAFGKKSKEAGRKDGAARSYCLKCGHSLGVLDLFPVFSYLILRGKCRHCGATYGREYFTVEVLTVMASVSCFLFYGLSLEALLLSFTLPVLISLLFIDLKHYILPNKLVLTFFLLGFLMQFYLGQLTLMTLFDVLLYTLLAWCIGAVFKVVLKKEALGFGDVKFYGAAGVWLGGMILPAFMVLSGILGVLHGVIMRFIFRQPIFPFGPSLIVSLILCYIFKEPLLSLLYE